MKKFMVWGIALALVISMGIVWFATNNVAEAVEEEPIDWASVIDWYYDDHKIWTEEHDFETVILNVDDSYGITYIDYMLLEDGERFMLDLIRGDWIKAEYDKYH